MKKHLEYQDEKSHKFWEIEVKDNSQTITYGKVGSKGQSNTKYFPFEEAAINDAEKKIKAKIKKGYFEISDEEIIYKTLSFEEANKAYKLDYEIMESMDNGYSVLVFEGDTIIDGDFSNWAGRFKKVEHSFLLFTGNLTVNGNTKLNGDLMFAVLGNFTSDYFYTNWGSYSLVVGNATIKYAVSVNYNDAYSDILGETTVPFYFNSDNASSINTSKNTISFGTGMADDEDFTLSKNLTRIIKSKYLKIEDDYLEEFKFDSFVETLKQGKSPFINIADKDFSLEFEKKDLLKRIVIKQGKKITSFTIKSQDGVAYVLEMPFLKNLTIEKSVSIPEALINKTSIEKLTTKIKLVNEIEIAKAVGNFNQIKELVVEDPFYRCKFNLDEKAPYLFKNLNKLKKLTIQEINQTAFALLPNLEQLYLTIDDSSNISGKHNLLKKLVIHKSRGEFENIHQFPNLEEFQLLDSFDLNKMAAPLQLKKLKKVILSYSYISDEIKQFFSCINLEYLSLTNEFSSFKRNDILGIRKLENLKHLELKIDLNSSYGRLTAIKGFNKQNINEIATLKKLKTLDLTGSIITIEDFEYLNKELPNTNITATIEQYSKNDDIKELTLIKTKQEFSISIFESGEGINTKKCKSLEDALNQIKAFKLKSTSAGWGKSVFIYNNDLGKYHLEYSVRITLKNNELSFKYSYRDKDDKQVHSTKVENYANYDDAEKAFTDFITKKLENGYETCD